MAEGASHVEVRREGAVVHVRLARPEKRNAFDDHVARGLAEAFGALERDAEARVVVLGGHGTVFCAGGDLEWMRRAASYTEAENLADAEAFQDAFENIKRTDAIIVGMYDRYVDQIAENCGYVRRFGATAA